MPRCRESLTLCPRKTKKGRTVWYYRTCDEYGQRPPGRSTGETSKTRARNYCNKLDRKGSLLPSDDPKFKVHAADWWLWEKFSYVAKNRRNGVISERRASDQRRILEDHLLTAFEKYHLSEITPKLIENPIYQELIERRGLSAKRAGNRPGLPRFDRQ